MHRHHPYGAPYENAGRRGGGPGADRRNRNSRGQPGQPMGRNRPSYGGYENSMSPYDSMPPNDMNSYGAYDDPDPYYHQNYGPPPPAPYPGPPYDHGYGAYEGPSHPENSGYRSGGPPPNHAGRGGKRQGRQPMEKLPDHVIEERISRERPCRTLFIRNIKYETPSEEIRRMFEEHGEIKTFFDLISNRGMVFVTFFDLRAAERARDRLQGSQLSNRPIDVHYSLPRDDQNSKGGEKDQGIIEVSLRSPSGAPIDEMELRRKLQPFGDLKSIMPLDGRSDARFIEFFDMRASEEVHRRLQNTALQDGVIDIQLCWDPNAGGKGEHDNDSKKGGSSGGGRHHRGGRKGNQRNHGSPNPLPSGLPPRPVDDGYSRRAPLPQDSYDRDRRRYDDDYYGDRYGPPPGSGYEPPPPSSGYGPPPPSNYGPPPDRGYGPPVPPAPIPAPPPPQDNRLDQARQVQQLLAQLKQPSSTPPPSQGPPPPSANGGYYGQTPPGAPGLPYSLNGTPAPSGPPPGSAGGLPPPAAVTLPPNISSLLSQATSQPPAQSYGVPAPSAGGQPLQQLMSYLQPKAP